MGRAAATSHALLLAQHGLIVVGRNLADAVAHAEELEATARLFLLRQDRPRRVLSEARIAELESTFPRSL